MDKLGKRKKPEWYAFYRIRTRFSPLELREGLLPKKLCESIVFICRNSSWDKEYGWRGGEKGRRERGSLTEGEGSHRRTNDL